MPKRLKIYFDGGCQPNPGAMEAAVVVRGVTHFFRGLGDGTNNDAEWLALIAALRVALALRVEDFVLLGDAATVIHQANGVWKCRGPELRAHRAVFDAIRGGCPVRVRKVARAQNLAGIALARA
jgi:ribonuclease HI